MYAGDIAAAVGLKDTFTGDTLTDPEHPVILESMTFPEPVIEVKIEPKTKADQDKLALALQRLAEEDPTFRVHTDPESAETLIAGHGRAPPRRARRPHGPRVQGRREHRQAAGLLPRDHPPGGGRQRPVRPPDRRQGPVRPRGHQARAAGEGRGLRVRRQDRRRHDPARVHQVRGRRHPRGARHGHLRRRSRSSTSRPRCYDGSYHEVDSSEMAFKIAGSMAVKDAVRQGRSGHPRADHAGRGDDARGVHGRRHRRPQQPARPDRGDGVARVDAGRAGIRAARPRCSAT